MNQNKTESKPQDVEEPRDEGLDETSCCASWLFLGTLQMSLTAGNFFFQACADQKWGQALERSFFQLVALFTVWLVCKITSSRHNVTVEGPAESATPQTEKGN